MHTNKCPTAGCTNTPSTDYQCSGMCYDCHLKHQQQGHATEPTTIGERAVQCIIQFQAGHPWPADMANAHTCLAKIGIMLTMYGSTAAALLNNMHERGFNGVTIEDVELVQRFILENY